MLTSPITQMSHQIAKLLLEKAGTFLERKEAIRAALGLGMPLNEIEAYLDWLDMVQGGGCKKRAERELTKEDPKDQTDDPAGPPR